MKGFLDRRSIRRASTSDRWHSAENRRKRINGSGSKHVDKRGLKENGPCNACGSWEQLEVDHVDRKHKVTHSVWSWSAARRTAELSKCQVLCKSCHLSKTTGDAHVPYVHGTHRMYVRAGCRCDACKEGHRITNAEWRRKQENTL